MTTLESYPVPSRGVRWPAFLKTKRGIVGLTILIGIVLLALLGPLLAPHPLAEPVGVPGSPPSGSALLGTDFLGRDVLSRLLDGGRAILLLTAVSITLTYLIGVTLGIVAGLSRSLVDPVVMRVVDLFLVFPPLLLLLVLIAGAGQSNAVLVIGIVLVLFPGVVRIVRAATLEISTTGYIEAAIARGETTRFMMREVLPNVVPAVLADAGLRFASAVILDASLNFLGVGLQPPAANWGLMIAENRPILQSNVWAVLAPAIVLALLTISVNLLGDAYAASLGRSGPR